MILTNFGKSLLKMLKKPHDSINIDEIAVDISHKTNKLVVAACMLFQNIGVSVAEFAGKAPMPVMYIPQRQSWVQCIIILYIA